MFVELEFHNFGNLPVLLAVRIVLIQVLLIKDPLYECITNLYKALILDLNDMYHLPVKYKMLQILTGKKVKEYNLLHKVIFQIFSTLQRSIYEFYNLKTG